MEKLAAALAIAFVLVILAGCEGPAPGINCGSVPLNDCLEAKALENLAPEYCKMIEPLAEKENCFRKLAVESREATICTLYASNKDDCLLELALNLKTVNACAGIVDHAKSNKCYYDMALATGNPEICLLAPQSKRDCIELLAKEQGSISLCTLLALPVERVECIESVSGMEGSDELCASFTDTITRDSCYLGIALKYGRAEDCLLLSRKRDTDACLSGIGAYTDEHIALKAYFASLCGEAVLPQIRDSCPEKMEGYSIDANTCDIFVQDKGDVILNLCLERLVPWIDGPQLCLKYKSMEKQFSCAEMFALDSNSIGPCKLMYVDVNRFGCFSAVAAASGDSGICDKIPTLDFRPLRNSCFEGVALGHLDQYACDRMVPDMDRAECRAKIAVQDNNLLVCAEIVNKPVSEPDPFLYRDSCFGIYARDMNSMGSCTHIHDLARQKSCETDVNALLHWQ